VKPINFFAWISFYYRSPEGQTREKIFRLLPTTEHQTAEAKRETWHTWQPKNLVVVKTDCLPITNFLDFSVRLLVCHLVELACLRARMYYRIFQIIAHIPRIFSTRRYFIFLHWFSLSSYESDDDFTQTRIVNLLVKQNQS